MIRYALLFLLLTSPVLGQDPAPADTERPQLTVGKDILGDGTRKNPYVFGPNTKCVIRLTGGGVESAVWELSDAPTDFEVIGNVGIFSLSEPGAYVVYVRGDKWHAKAWFQVDAGQGPRPPPPVEDGISKRVKAALIGHAEDARKYAEVWRQLADKMEAGAFTMQSHFENAAVAAMSASGLKAKTYADISTLGAELFDRGETDWAFTAEVQTDFTKKLRTMSKAAAEVK